MASAMALALAMAVSFPAISFSSGGATAPTPKCATGKIYDKKQKKCVDEDTSSLNQDSIFETGRALAYSERYDEAIRVLSLAKDKSDPRVLNMLGYSHRKTGQIELALGFYEQSIAQNPNYSLVREYLGEAYIELGMLEKAREQLSEIERICESRSCDEYHQLASLMVKSQL
jgi:tetratricopeptide (TPR) repeat protein